MLYWSEYFFIIKLWQNNININQPIWFDSHVQLWCYFANECGYSQLGAMIWLEGFKQCLTFRATISVKQYFLSTKLSAT